MFIGLKLAGIILGLYCGIQLARLGIKWAKYSLKELEPPKNDD